MSRSKPIRAVHLNTPKLPDNFAETLLELETQVAFNLSTNLISALMQHYSIAIEYYESVQDKKYLHYKERLHSLLSRKDVIETLSGPAVKSPQPSMLVSPASRNTSKTEPIFKFENPKPPGQAPKLKLKADQTINEHLQESSTQIVLVKDNLKKQEGDKLQERIQARRRANSLRPQKSEKKLSPRDKLELFQKEIEEIMEKYAEEKILKVQAIKKRYDENCKEYLAGNFEEIETKMKSEIDKAQEEILKERKEKIELARVKYKANKF